jgi:hypothetical protein
MSDAVTTKTSENFRCRRFPMEKSKNWDSTESLIESLHASRKELSLVANPAYLDDEKFKKMKEYGADLCFSKPLPLPQLRKEVATLLELA